jgi:hypothetical protein
MIKENIFDCFNQKKIKDFFLFFYCVLIKSKKLRYRMRLVIKFQKYLKAALSKKKVCIY